MEITIPNDASLGTYKVEVGGTVAYTGLMYGNFTAGGVSYYRGASATFPAYQQDMAVYRPQTNRTYFTWANAATSAAPGDVAKAFAVVGAFDHGTGQIVDVSKPIAFADADGHRNPSLLIDAEGYVYVFGGSHGDATKVMRTTTPYDIKNWMVCANVPGVTTYPQPVELEPGVITLFYRDGYTWVYRRSTDRCANWSGPVEVIKPMPQPRMGAYAIKGDKGTNVHFAWTVLDFDTQLRKNVWYIKSNGGQAFTKADGSALTLPVAGNGGDLIFDSGDDQVNLHNIQFDGAEPVILISHGVTGSPWNWKVLRRVSGTWQAYAVPATADRQFDCGAILVLSASDYRAYLPSAAGQAGEDGGNIEEWRSVDRGITWTLFKQLTDDPFNHNHIKVVRDGTQAFRAFWSYGDARLVITSNSDKIGNLKFLADDKGVETIRSGNPYQRSVKVTRDSVVSPLIDQQLGSAGNTITMKFDRASLDFKTE